MYSYVCSRIAYQSQYTLQILYDRATVSNTRLGLGCHIICLDLVYLRSGYQELNKESVYVCMGEWEREFVCVWEREGILEEIESEKEIYMTR